ncbi:hypothetical protein [Aquitalea magnusonii]|nr:hypothetical protein [Aquitalea magnusonii]
MQRQRGSEKGMVTVQKEDIQELLNHFDRLDAEVRSRAQPACPTCGGHGMVGGPSYREPDEGGQPCPDCSKPGADVVALPADWVRGLLLGDRQHHNAIRELLASPPTHAVPDEIDCDNAPWMSADTEPDIAYANGWNACRAAMLAKGVK